MDEATRRMVALVLMFLVPFVLQSLPLVYSRSTLYKVLPLVMFLVPLECIVEMAWDCGDPWEALTKYAVILLPMTAGNVLGWVLGLHFRKIVDREHTVHTAEDTEPKDDF